MRPLTFLTFNYP